MYLRQLGFSITKNILTLSIFITGCSTSAVAGSIDDESQDPSSLRQVEIDLYTSDKNALPPIEHKIAKVLQEHPSDLMATYLMSSLLLRQYSADPGSYELVKQSTDLAAQTFDLNRSSELPIAALANILLVTGDIQRGISLINQAEKRGIKLGWRSQLAKAKLYLSESNYELAMTALEQASQNTAIPFEILSPVVVEAVTSKYQGEDVISQLQAWRPRCKSIDLELAIANALGMNLRYQEAIDAFKSILAVEPGNREAAFSLGIIYLHHFAATKMAIPYFETAIKFSTVDSDKAVIQSHLALAMLESKGNFEETARISAIAIRDSEDPEKSLLMLLGGAQKNLPPINLLVLLDRILVNSPGLHLAHALKAEILSDKLAKHIEAKRSFSDAITLNPERSEYYNGRGLASLGLLDLDQAVSDFATAIKINPEDASARYNMACVRARQGMNDDALQSLERAIQIDDRLASNAKTDSDFKNLWSLPGFKTILNKDRNSSTLAH